MLFVNNLRAEIYATDHWRAYSILPEDRHIRSKAHTYTVEGKNGQIRHYLARFRRRTKCYSKAVHMVIATLVIYYNQHLISRIYY
jgi:insertion element IS1 protein InsB